MILHYLVKIEAPKHKLSF